MNPIKRISLFLLIALFMVKPCAAQLRDLIVKPDVKRGIVEVSAGLSDNRVDGGKKVLATLSFSSPSSGLPGYPKPIARSLIMPDDKGVRPFFVTVKGWNADQLWRPNSPFQEGYRAPLQRLTLTLTYGKKTVQTLQKDFVLCEMKSDATGYRLNGKPIALRQVTLKGDTLLDRKTIDTYLQRGINVLKAKETPFSRATLKLCRTQGMISVQPDDKGDAGGTSFRATTPIPEAVLTTLELLERDTKTQGNWFGVYGKEAFFVSIPDGSSNFALPGISVSRNSDGIRPYSKEKTLTDPRLLSSSPGSSLRSPHAFSNRTGSLIFRVKSTDSNPHVFSLYLLDFYRRKEKYTLRFYDDNAFFLGKEKVANFEEGVYLKGRFTGVLLIEFLNSDSLKEANAWGLFVDPN